MSEMLTPSLRLFKIVGDETRLKILMILEAAEFTVGELVRILHIHQSNASRHLQQLREGQLVHDRREGALVYYRWSEALRSSKDLQQTLKHAWTELPDQEALRGHVDMILDQRRSKSQDFFDSVAGRYRKLAEPGGGSETLLRAFASILNVGHAVDVGCGEGDLSLLLARGATQVTAIDFNRKMLDILQERSQRDGILNIEARQGDMEHLPLEDNEADLVVMSQVLHHSTSPTTSLKEMLRILKPQGTWLILDLMAHDQDWVRESLGDQWLGFTLERINEWLGQLGAQASVAEVVHVQEGLPTILLAGHKP